MKIKNGWRKMKKIPGYFQVFQVIFPKNPKLFPGQFFYPMVGEDFEIYTSEMAKNALKILHHGWRKI